MARPSAGVSSGFVVEDERAEFLVIPFLSAKESVLDTDADVFTSPHATERAHSPSKDSLEAGIHRWTIATCLAWLVPLYEQHANNVSSWE